MSKKITKKQGTEIDEHDLPTEPVPFFIPPPQMDTIPAPPPQQPITLGPFQQPPLFPSSQVSPSIPMPDVYPYRAPQPLQPSMEPQQPIGAKTPPQSVPQSPFYASLIPLSIGLCFVCIQMLLLARFVLRLFEITGVASWVNTIYALCDIFLLPFQALLPPLQLPALISTRVELYTLLAVLVYGIISRIIVRLLKILLRTRQPGAVQRVK